MRDTHVMCHVIESMTRENLPRTKKQASKPRSHLHAQAASCPQLTPTGMSWDADLPQHPRTT